MTWKFTVGRPKVLSPKRLKRRWDQILESRQFTNGGVWVQKLEEQISDWNGSEVIAVCNATIGLALVAQALNLRGRVVGVPSFTFPATAHCLAGSEIRWQDVELWNYGIRPERLKDLGAVCGVNLFGSVCSVDLISQTAGTVIWDSAHALGVNRLGRGLNSGGAAEVFSLHSTKFISGGEGGLICTRDSNLAKKLREMRNFGFSLQADPHGELISWGTNAKLSEVHAAMSLTNWEDREDLREGNLRNWLEYQQNLDEWLFDPESNDCRSNFSYVVMHVQSSRRDRLLQHLLDGGIYARKYFQPLHHSKPYQGLPVILPNTDLLASQVICLPTGPTVKPKHVRQICKVIRSFK